MSVKTHEPNTWYVFHDTTNNRELWLILCSLKIDEGTCRYAYENSAAKDMHCKRCFLVFGDERFRPILQLAGAAPTKRGTGECCCCCLCRKQDGRQVCILFLLLWLTRRRSRGLRYIVSFVVRPAVRSRSVRCGWSGAGSVSFSESVKDTRNR